MWWSDVHLRLRWDFPQFPGAWPIFFFVRYLFLRFVRKIIMQVNSLDLCISENCIPPSLSVKAVWNLTWGIAFTQILKTLISCPLTSCVAVESLSPFRFFISLGAHSFICPTNAHRRGFHLICIDIEFIFPLPSLQMVCQPLPWVLSLLAFWCLVGGGFEGVSCLPPILRDFYFGYPKVSSVSLC